MLHIKLKGITKCSNMVANILSADPPPQMTLGDGSIGQNSTFSEQGHIAYQIKGSHKCCNMLSNTVPQTPSPHDPRGSDQKVKIHFFQNMVMLHIKLKGITKCSNIVANILHADPYPLSPPRPWVWVNMSNFNPHDHRGGCQNSTFSEHGHVAYQIKENYKCSNMVENIFPADPSTPPAPLPNP